MPDLKLSLHCDIGTGKYTLRSDAENWSRCFANSMEAIQHVATLVQTETFIVVYDSDQNVMMTTTVYPASTR